MHNFFSVFDFPVSFEVNLKELEQRYFAVQRACHPDRFVGKPAQERQQAMLRSMQANEAFEALKNPLQRARHMLALQGIQVGGEKDTVKPSHALLMEIMELREALEEAESAEALSALKNSSNEQVTAELERLSTAFAANDTGKASAAVMRLGYLVKISEEITRKLKVA